MPEAKYWGSPDHTPGPIPGEVPVSCQFHLAVSCHLSILSFPKSQQAQKFCGQNGERKKEAANKTKQWPFYCVNRNM